MKRNGAQTMTLTESITARVKYGDRYKGVFCYPKESGEDKWQVIGITSTNFARIVRSDGDNFVRLVDAEAFDEAEAQRMVDGYEGRMQRAERRGTPLEELQELRKAYYIAWDKLCVITEVNNFLQGVESDKVYRRIAANMALAIDLDQSWWRKRKNWELHQYIADFSVEPDVFRLANGVRKQGDK